MPITTVIFDAYGTLFDVGAAARALAETGADPKLTTCWQKLAADWRQKQLQYTWLRAVADQHTDFWTVTQNGLDWAMEANGLDAPETRTALLDLYWQLEAYPEVSDMLKTLKSQGQKTGILSNGSKDMLTAAVSSAGLSDTLDVVLSVDDVGIFKPARQVYDMVGAALGCAREEVLFVSSNGWDAAGAAHYGFQTVWVNRAGEPRDRLYAGPQFEMSDLTTIPELI
ncbi:MAG: haloacid dehalogenase type II [Pseudomonadota bacterium]